METTRTFATLFADMDIRQRLIMACSVEMFRWAKHFLLKKKKIFFFSATLLKAAKELAFEQSQWRERKTSIHLSQAKEHVVSLKNLFNSKTSFN